MAFIDTKRVVKQLKVKLADKLKKHFDRTCNFESTKLLVSNKD